MNHREPPHLPAGARRALHCLALLLVPAMAPVGAQALTRSRPASAGSEPRPAPYLPVLGAMSLRFQEAAPPPDLATRPPAAAPPTPAQTRTETSVAIANAAAAHSAAPFATPEATEAPVAAAPPPGNEPSAPSAKTPPAILPDDARPPTRPEEVLPYFQIPGAAQRLEDVTLLAPALRVAPAPAPIPNSSATYTQTPK